jgi:hypothetical protein
LSPAALGFPPGGPIATGEQLPDYGQLDVFAVRNDGTLWVFWESFDGNWANGPMAGNIGSVFPPGAAVMATNLSISAPEEPGYVPWGWAADVGSDPGGEGGPGVDVFSLSVFAVDRNAAMRQGRVDGRMWRSISMRLSLSALMKSSRGGSVTRSVSGE